VRSLETALTTFSSTLPTPEWKIPNAGRTEASKGNEGIRIGNKGALYRCAASSTRDSSPLLRLLFFRVVRLPQESKRLVATRRETGSQTTNDRTPCNGNVHAS
jgi:hypothetical protein